MYKLPNKLKAFTPYEPLTGSYPVRLDVNESYFEISTDEVIRAVAEIDRVKLNRYPDPYAIKLVNAFADLFKISPNCVTAGNGSDELIGLITAGLLEKGDGILVLSNDFSMYSFYARLYELDAHELSKRENFTVNVDGVIGYINENDIKCFIFSNPCNPTSLGLNKTDVERIVTQTNALIVVDEAYMDFWDEQHSMLDTIEIYNNLIVLRTCSKSVALAGIRVGFAAACAEITNALRMLKSPFNVNSVSQSIATATLTAQNGYKESISRIKESTKMLKTALEEFMIQGIFEHVYDTKTNFVFIKTKTNKAGEIYEFLLERGIAIRCFPPDHLRICAGTGEEMNTLYKELSAWRIQELGK
ncbi:MAG: aminotransferase class I/II-fold pyridoxal phosphate-dependent enzyme [Oscillospiraceae bacterium]|nr:aminotransferase class I/II-fold pyridoxal phosphate-dependent enzyme [Oscillospiraceae bacterium]